MPLTPQEIKEKLLKTIDNDHNVVDMAGALELLSVLEKFPITREALEQTRIGRIVNNIRKKTTNKDFAKRIKNLVRRWQELCNPVPATEPVATETSSLEASTRVNGKGPINARLIDGHPHLKGPANFRPASPASRPETPCSIRSSASSPRSIHGTSVASVSVSRRDVVETNSSASNFAKLSTEVTSKPVAVSPRVGSLLAVSHRGSSLTKLHSAPTTPMNSTNLIQAEGTISHHPSVTNFATSLKRKRCEEDYPGIKLKIKKSDVQINNFVAKSSSSVSNTWSCMSDMSHKSSVNGVMVSTPQAMTAAAPNPSSSNPTPTNVLPGKAKRGRPPNSITRKSVSLVQPSSTVQTPNTSLKADSTSVNRLDSTSVSVPKVATTAELIQKLHASGDLRLVASETMKKIASNLIVKESFDEESVVPASAKPRPRKKHSAAALPPPSTPDMMSRVKNEMVHKYLESSVQQNSSCDSGLMNLLEHLDPPPEPDVVDSKSNSDISKKLRDPVAGQNTVELVIKPSVALNNPWDLLPPLNPAQIDWTSTDYTVPETQSPITDDVVGRLHTSDWEAVNGQYDYQNEWSDWSKTYSVPSYNGELLHILPYVNIYD